MFVTGPNAASVLIHGRPLSPRHLAEHCRAILDVFYAGEEGGHAIANILFGDVNPSGKLPVTIARNVGQLPAFYYQKPTGKFRNYVFSNSTPLYPFWHGLSYTSFVCGEPRASSASVARGGKVQIEVAVQNTGERAGQEVVQLYTRDEIASRTRPVKQLRGFENIALAAGEASTVTFELQTDDFGFRNGEGKLLVEPGRFVLMAGPDSENLKSTNFVIT